MAEETTASAICRGQTIKYDTILRYVDAMPRVPMAKVDFDAFIEKRFKGWIGTHYQPAKQAALYYEDNGICYPRFKNKVSVQDVVDYIINWATKYFAPNPYTKDLLKVYNGAPINIYAYLRKNILEGNTNFKEVCKTMFGGVDVLNNIDKIKAYIIAFTNININDSGEMSIKDGYCDKNIEIYPEISRDCTGKEYFMYFDTISSTEKVDNANEHYESFQQIFYGAPGTGKSFKVNERTKEEEKVFRTTFHPDSDYSTFVGCYKPTMRREERLLSKEELEKVLPLQSEETYACQKFATKYWYSLDQLTPKEINEILENRGYKKSMYQEINKGIAVGKKFENQQEGRIVYEFVPQAFLQAYVQAWKYLGEAEDDNPRKQSLVIEEINRGNCAQIFGDIFQLLDRNPYGFSNYPINADKDIQAYLKRELGELKVSKADKINGLYKKDVVFKVLNGEQLLLPNNFYIWATMNTSDQSLFPIDSAFKRRWEWKYVPIDNVPEKKWKIVIGEEKYGWWEFLKKINVLIGEKTNSEDKKLGFFFCNANSDDVIDANMFVGKVLFYLWNDVFKDYEFEGDLFVSTDKQTLTFDKFYKGFEAVNEDEVNHWLKKLMSEKEPPQTSSAMDS